MLSFKQLNISGKGDDVLWNKAAILDNFVSPWNTDKKSEIIFKALWDRENFFFNFTVLDTAIHLEKTDKAEAGYDIHNVLCNGYVHGNTGVLHTDVPSGESV